MIKTLLRNKILYVLVENNDERIYSFFEEFGYNPFQYDVDTNSLIQFDRTKENVLFEMTKQELDLRLQRQKVINVQGISI
jgi:hypothetical protein